MPYHGSLARLVRLGYGTYGIRGLSECLYSRLATYGQFDHGLTSQSGSWRYKSGFLYLRLYAVVPTSTIAPVYLQRLSLCPIRPLVQVLSSLWCYRYCHTHYFCYQYSHTLSLMAIHRDSPSLGSRFESTLRHSVSTAGILPYSILYVALSSSSMATISNTYHATALSTLRSMLQSSTFVRVSSAGRANINRTGIS